MPARIHENPFGAWFQAGTEIIDIPIPTLLTHGLGISILTVSEKVIAKSKIGAKA
jgi:hypothetical protein